MYGDYLFVGLLSYFCEVVLERGGGQKERGLVCDRSVGVWVCYLKGMKAELVNR